MIEHHLPGEGPNTAWFEKLNAFEQQETLRHVRFKREQLGGLESGPLPTKPVHHYPHILPAGTDVRRIFFESIADDVLAYCGDEDIALHSQVLNLRSSQVCCFNVMFPMRQDPGLAAAALTPLLPGVRRVTGIEFEYTGPPEMTELLGEPTSGKRGQNRTSIDCAVAWDDGGERHLTLVEWKYTERTFGECGGYRSRGNPDRSVCDEMDVMNDESTARCYLSAKHRRRYWEKLCLAGIDCEVLVRVHGCPFRGPFYQLMRQYVLSACAADLLPGVKVDVAYVGFRGNQSILDVPSELRPLGGSVLDAWNAAVRKPLHHVNVEDIVDSTRRRGTGADGRWLSYLSDRYGL